MNKGFLSISLRTDLKDLLMKTLQYILYYQKQIECNISFPILLNDFVRKKSLTINSINDFHILAYNENIFLIKIIPTQNYVFIDTIDYPLIRITDDLAKMIFILFDYMSKFNFALDKNYYEPQMIDTIFNSIKELNEKKEEIENES